MIVPVPRQGWRRPGAARSYWSHGRQTLSRSTFLLQKSRVLFGVGNRKTSVRNGRKGQEGSSVSVPSCVASAALLALGCGLRRTSGGAAGRTAAGG